VRGTGVQDQSEDEDKERAGRKGKEIERGTGQNKGFICIALSSLTKKAGWLISKDITYEVITQPRNVNFFCSTLFGITWHDYPF
jgi:hypothetical protein